MRRILDETLLKKELWLRCIGLSRKAAANIPTDTNNELIQSTLDDFICSQIQASMVALLPAMTIKFENSKSRKRASRHLFSRNFNYAGFLYHIYHQNFINVGIKIHRGQWENQ